MRVYNLKNLIYKNFLTSSLIPIFVIELALLVLYFSINAYISTQSKSTLLNEAKMNVREILQREANGINQQLKEISNIAKMVQSDQQYFFENIESIQTLKKPIFDISDSEVFYKKNREGSSLFYSNTTDIGDRELEKATKSENFDLMFKNIVDTNEIAVATYFNSFDNMNRYYPFIEKVYTQYPANLTMSNYNFYYEADLKHNPKKEPRWTDAYLDPAGMGWMVSCIVPIYNRDFLEGVSGIDVTIDSFIKHILDIKLPWDSNLFLVNKDGVILAMPSEIEELLELKELKEHKYSDSIKSTLLKPEEFNIFQNSNEQIVNIFKESFNSSRLFEIAFQSEKYLLSSVEIKETSWQVFMIVDKERLLEPISKLEQLSKNIGYVAIVVMILFYFLFFIFLQKKSKRLSRNISAPIENLATITKDIGTSLNNTELKPIGVREIDSLYDNFNKMSSTLNIRTQELIDSKIEAKLKEKEAEIAYSQGLFESASSYLHNIGNSLSGLDSKLLRIKKSIDSMSNYNLVFNRLRDTHRAELEGREREFDENIDRFEKILLKVKESFSNEINSISEIREHIVQTIRHQQALFKDSNYSKEKFSQKFNLSSVIDNIIFDLEDSFRTNNIEVILNRDENLIIENQKHQFIQGFFNILKNSIEAINEAKELHGIIRVEAKNLGKHIIINFSDNGVGISKDNLNNILKAGFTTKSNGHGLGLHSFNNFLKENRATLRVSSEGLNKGATFTLEIENE